MHNAADNLSRLKLRVLAHGEEKGGKACGPPKDGKDVAHFNEEEFEIWNIVDQLLENCSSNI